MSADEQANATLDAANTILKDNAERCSSTSARSVASDRPASSNDSDDNDDHGDEVDRDNEAGRHHSDGDGQKEGAGADGQQPFVHKKGAWTAVWDSTHNAYYFFNSVTNVTTWRNPLQDGQLDTSDDRADASDTQGAQPHGQKDALGGIDPDLAFLDPNLSRTASGGGPNFNFHARFDAKSGRFQWTRPRVSLDTYNDEADLEWVGSVGSNRRP
ncbi:hypothetical protein OIO90_005157 [Microbotryomycetes sp. JL221]|nr:hypothetical protein OIO90_005157 [Microbotryomycetes sp. JL221]